MADQESVHHMDNDVTSSDDLQKTYTVDEFEVRILQLEKPGGHWETKSTIPMQLFENALTVRIVTLHVCFFSVPLETKLIELSCQPSGDYLVELSKLSCQPSGHTLSNLIPYISTHSNSNIELIA